MKSLLLCLFAAALAINLQDDDLVLHPDLIAEVNAHPDHTWTAGHNTRFAGVTYGEARKLLGTINALPIGSVIDNTPVDASAVPDEFDAREKWNSCMVLIPISSFSPVRPCRYPSYS